MRLAMQSGTLVPAARKVMPMMTSGMPRVKPMMVTYMLWEQLHFKLSKNMIFRLPREEPPGQIWMSVLVCLYFQSPFVLDLSINRGGATGRPSPT